MSFRRIAIVNRGEAAMRFIHAVREFNREHDTDLVTIAIYTDPERRAMFVREADESIALGPASVVDPRDGERKNAYLNYEALERVLVESRAEAVWLGWGFVAEQADFADLCEKKLGLAFIGPDGDCMRRLGDKITSKTMAEESGVPVAPWSGGPVPDLAEARVQAEQIGCPFMIKATSGGGGRGIRAVREPCDLEENYRRATSEALKSFGDGTVFIEKLVDGARHIEVQVVADEHGNVWSVGVRDCSVQRRNQKLIEESSSPALTQEQEAFVMEAAARLCKTSGYRNAGTVEFLYDPKTEQFAFMEVNARLQVEHPVTEASTGVDLVKLQLHVARGGRLEGEPPPARGTAIEVRLNAEDPDRDFAPAPGRVALFRLPTGAGIRVDTGVEQGDRIPSEFDSMIAKIIVHGRDRPEALARLRRALSELAVVIRGGTTNRSFLLDLLNLPPVIDGTADVGWLDREPPSSWDQRRPHAALALLLAAVDVYQAEAKVERRVFMASAARGRPKLAGTIGRTMELNHGGNEYRLKVWRCADQTYRIDVDGQSARLDVERVSKFERRLVVQGQTHRALCVSDGIGFRIEINGVPHRVSRDEGGIVRSVAPAVVVAVDVAEGARVQQGDVLFVLEAMKLETVVAAPYAGIVKKIHVTQNEQVEAGGSLLMLQASAESVAARSAERLDFAALNPTTDCPTPARERCLQILDELQYSVLGYDVDEKHTKALVQERLALCDNVAADDASMMAAEDLLLRRFADLSALSLRQPATAADGLPGSMQPSPQQSLHTYVRALHTHGEGLPSAFLSDLKRALAHYMIDDLSHGRGLEEALVLIHNAHVRVTSQLPAVVSILERRLRNLGTILPGVDEEQRDLLLRLTDVSRGRYHAVADLARELRYQYFEKPLFDEVRQTTYRDAEMHIRYLAETPDGPDRQSHMDALVECPQPLMTLLSDYYAKADLAMRGQVLECLTRRYYRIRNLEQQAVRTENGLPVFTAEYLHDSSRFFLTTVRCDYENLTRTGELLQPILDAAPPDSELLIDFYVHRDTPDVSEQDTLDHIRRALNEVSFQRAPHRVLTSVRIPGTGLGMTGQRFFTFRPSESGLAEDRILRNVHPMTAKRLDFWRYSEFSLKRLPSIEDVYLFHGVAHDNSRDQRLIALAEVRDLTPSTDDDGNVTGLPNLEYMFQEACAGIRLAQAQRAPRDRLHWNRVMLYVWPPVPLARTEVNRIIRKMMPMTAGLGLEKAVVRARLRRPGGGEPRESIMQVTRHAGERPVVQFFEPADHTVQPLTPYRQKVMKMRSRGLHYPYEIIRSLTPDEHQQSPFPHGQFTEYDMDDAGALVPVERPFGENRANVVVGLIANRTDKYPEGIQRVMILGDPSRGMGALAEPECARIIAALDLAKELGIPVDWFAVSAGAKIAMDSGTENLDWTARVLRHLIEFTQAGGEVNLVVHGINVGAQSYWNAEATMLMHTRGILIMTPQGAMVLTGKQALDFSGGVSAEDNLGIGGYDRIMGPNGQAQYWAADLDEACHILLQHHQHCYRVPGERFPRQAQTSDPIDRDISDYPYGDGDVVEFSRVGDIFDNDTNPGRKRPFQIRKVMRAVADQDLEPLERWSAMRDAEIGVIWDAHLGGNPVCLIGLESQPITRTGFVPADGPDYWTAGTLFPGSSRKVGRAINAASNNRPVVILANLSGFDGSPESMREWQLEYGAEIGRAIVNFKGPIVFCVISRYHGGAFVVFSKALNETLEVAALEGAFASVIGGAPAAAVVFARDVRKKTLADPELAALREQLDAAGSPERGKLLTRYEELFKKKQAHQRGILAEHFDQVHSVARAREVGSIDTIIPPGGLRRYLIEAVERGIQREQQRLAESNGETDTGPPLTATDT